MGTVQAEMKKVEEEHEVLEPLNRMVDEQQVHVWEGKVLLKARSSCCKMQGASLPGIPLVRLCNSPAVEESAGWVSPPSPLAGTCRLPI